MGRRLIGGAFVALGLLAASLAWTGFGALRTVFDPERSERVAETIFDDPQVRDQLRASLADSLETAAPDGTPVPRQLLLAAADAALDDPAVRALVFEGLVRSHQRFLGLDPEPDEPIVIDGAAIGSAARNALVTTRPELAPVLPPPPSLPITLPTEGIPDAGGLRSWLVGTVTLLALVASGLVVTAFVVTNDRPRVLRRVGFWGIGAGAAWVVLGLALPEAARLILPGSAAIFAAILGAAFEGMIAPSVRAVTWGAGAVVLATVWWLVARVVRLARGDRRGAPRRAEPVAAAAPFAPVDPMRAASRSPVVTAPHPVTRVPAAGGPVAAPFRAVADPTRLATGARTPPGGVSMGSPPLPGRAPTWVEGVGYVDDPDAVDPPPVAPR